MNALKSFADNLDPVQLMFHFPGVIPCAKDDNILQLCEALNVLKYDVRKTMEKQLSFEIKREKGSNYPFFIRALRIFETSPEIICAVMKKTAESMAGTTYPPKFYINLAWISKTIVISEWEGFNNFRHGLMEVLRDVLKGCAMQLERPMIHVHENGINVKCQNGDVFHTSWNNDWKIQLSKRQGFQQVLKKVHA